MFIIWIIFLSYVLGTFLDLITSFHYKNDLNALKKLFIGFILIF